jgi:hypothetical protein
VVLLDSAFPLSFSKSQALLDQVLGVQIICRTIATISRDVWHYLEQAWIAQSLRPHLEQRSGMKSCAAPSLPQNG